MIVADASLLVPFWVEVPHSVLARTARRKDASWIAPPLWRSEFRSALRRYMLSDQMSYADALWYAKQAERMMARMTRDVATAGVLKLVQQTGHSSYDCEYIALAQAEGVSLVTADKKLAGLFPDTAVLLSDFVA